MPDIKDLQTLLTEIPQPTVGGTTSATRISYGRVFVPQQQILLYSPNEWEEFTREWVHSQKTKYINVLRLTGANDMGVDIAGLTDDLGLFGIWDNFQCKHYKDSLTPSIAATEIGKILWHSFSKQYNAPRRYYFIAPQDCGMKLKKMLLQPDVLKSYVKENWETCCANKISSTEILLDGDFLTYLDKFDFSIFSSYDTIKVIDEHRGTPYYSVRFGNGLPDRPAVTDPPIEVSVDESRYITQLFEAYGDYKKIKVGALSDLQYYLDLTNHFNRQRELFYHAEALRNFARDTVPPGTFENLQEEVYVGVIDIEASSFENGFLRLNAVSTAATSLQLTSNALISVIKIQDRKGICHQLANEDRLIWKKT